MLTTKLRWTMSLALLGMLAFVVGCNGDDSTPTESAGGTSTTSVADTADHDDHDHEEGEEHGAHDGWWCNEHGVPEGECSRCDSSLIADFKAKGDWCEKHDRPESQCFLCDASRADKFIARYEAKFGKQPPAPEEEGEEN